MFVKEIVPRTAIALTARWLYGENYVALRMQHRIAKASDSKTVSYHWWLRGREQRIDMSVRDELSELTEGSEAEFITEHYWGYARARGSRTIEYRVEHPRWRVSVATSARLECDTAHLYGARFVESLSADPVSAFLAEGSEAAVFPGCRLDLHGNAVGG